MEWFVVHRKKSLSTQREKGEGRGKSEGLETEPHL